MEAIPNNVMNVGGRAHACYFVILYVFVLNTQAYILVEFGEQSIQ